MSDARRPRSASPAAHRSVVSRAGGIFRSGEPLQFRRLLALTDAQNVDLMGLAGFCRNCLGDWLAEESGGALTAEQGREAIYGMPYVEWKAPHQRPASEEQIARMTASGARNAR